MIGSLEPVANQVLQNLNQRLAELQVTTTRINDLLNDKNRNEISGSLGNLNSMLSDGRPKIAASLTKVQNATPQLTPILDNLKTTMTRANDVLSHPRYGPRRESSVGHPDHRYPIARNNRLGLGAYGATQEHDNKQHRQHRPDHVEYPCNDRKPENVNGFIEEQPLCSHPRG